MVEMQGKYIKPRKKEPASKANIYLIILIQPTVKKNGRNFPGSYVAFIEAKIEWSKIQLDRSKWNGFQELPRWNP